MKEKVATPLLHGMGTFSYKGTLSITNEKGTAGEAGNVIAEQTYDTDINGVVSAATLFTLDEITGERRPATPEDINNLEQDLHDYNWYCEVTSGMVHHTFTMSAVDDSGNLKQIVNEVNTSLPMARLRFSLSHRDRR